MDSKKHPIKNLTSQLARHNAFTNKNLPKIAAFYLKLFIQEPFRIWENISYSDNLEQHTLEEDPIFIIGHWRSGTSFLQYLLAQDPRFGYMNKFQVVCPDVFLSSEHFLKSITDRIPDTLELVRDAQNMSINLDLDSPSEIEIALTTMISPTSLHWGHIFPQDAWRYFDKYLFFDAAEKDEIQKWKRHYHHLIKKTSLKNSGRRLLIKSPGNAARMNALLDLYPNAQFIFIHRNPYDVFYSSKKLWNTLLNNLALQDFSNAQMENEIIRVYKKLMSRYLQQRTNVPEHQLIELAFDDFISRPIEMVDVIYDHLKLNDFKTAAPEMQQFLEQKSRKASNYNYEDRILKSVNRNWKFAFNEWDYSIIKADEPAAVNL